MVEEGAPEREREWRPAWPCPVGALLVQHRRGAHDPTWFRDDAGWWRATRTPQGPARLLVTVRADHDDRVNARAWGRGADWVLDRLPDLLGARDDVSDFVPDDPLVERAHRAEPHWRYSRTGLVLESLVPSIIEQKVTAHEAFGAYRRLVLAYGTPAPGPGDAPPLWVPPEADTLRRIPSWEWTQLGIDASRARTLAGVVRVAGSLERFGESTGAELEQALTSVPGVGRWTSAEVRARVLGDPDAVSYGDYHLSSDIGWAVRGEEFSDEELAQYLAPWVGHRGRVATLVRKVAGRRPRRGPRSSPRTHLPIRRGFRGGGAGGSGRTR